MLETFRNRLVWRTGLKQRILIINMRCTTNQTIVTNWKISNPNLQKSIFVSFITITQKLILFENWQLTIDDWQYCSALFWSKSNLVLWKHLLFVFCILFSYTDIVSLFLLWHLVVLLLLWDDNYVCYEVRWFGSSFGMYKKGGEG